MGPLLLIVALLAGGAAYYEYNWQQQSSAGFQAQVQDWENQLAKLKSENKQLNDAKANLAQQAVMARSLAALPAAPLSSSPSAAQQPTPVKPVLPPPTGTGSIEDLGTFTTIDGKTYQDAKLLKIEATDIVISSSDVITQVEYAMMPADMQKRFGWDPQKSADVTAAALRYQEQVDAARQAAAAQDANSASAPPPPANPNLVPGMAPAPGTTPPAP
jgi:hypothetical protein